MVKILMLGNGRGSKMQTVEKNLISIWQEMFDTQDISPSSDFFELGGNSLTAIKFLDQVEKTYGTEALQPDTLFSNSQLSYLATVIAEKVSES